MNKLISNLEEQLKKVKTKHLTEINEDTYWRGVMIGLETGINVAKELSEQSSKKVNNRRHELFSLFKKTDLEYIQQQKAYDIVVEDVLKIIKP